MASDSAVDWAGQVTFGPFRLLPARQLLLDGEEPVHLGSRACEILITLVERAGQLLSNQELMRRVWPNTFVEDGNLRVHVAALRRALRDGQAGNRYITNVPGRGSCFVAPVDRREAPEVTVPAPKVLERPTDVPVPLAHVVGPSDVVPAMVTQLKLHRFVTNV